MYILCTRPINESQSIAKVLVKLGFKPIIEPLINITPVKDWQKIYDKTDKSNIGIVIFTSQHAIKEFALYEKKRNFPIAVVGKASKKVASDLGFINILQARGSAVSLINLIKRQKFTGKILYIAGEDITTDITNILTAEGFETQKIIVYQASLTKNLSKEVSYMLCQQQFTAILFFSSRTAQNFYNLLIQNSLKVDLTKTKLFALSRKIAKVLSLLKWQKIYIATKPEMDSLIRLLERKVND